MKNVLIAIIVMSILVIIVAIVTGNNGIVILEGYGEAVALCGDELGDKAHDIKGTAHMRLWDGNTFTINWGHLDDTEVSELRELAKQQCQQYKK